MDVEMDGWVGGWMVETDLRQDTYVSLYAKSRLLLFSFFFISGLSFLKSPTKENLLYTS